MNVDKMASILKSARPIPILTLPPCVDRVNRIKSRSVHCVVLPLHEPTGQLQQLREQCATAVDGHVGYPGPGHISLVYIASEYLEDLLRLMPEMHVGHEFPSVTKQIAPSTSELATAASAADDQVTSFSPLMFYRSLCFAGSSAIGHATTSTTILVHSGSDICGGEVQTGSQSLEYSVWQQWRLVPRIRCKDALSPSLSRRLQKEDLEI